MALYVYNKASGALYSSAPTDDSPVASAEDLAANGLAVVTKLAALDDTHAWDPATRSVIAVAAPTKPKPITTGKWIMRFTPLEFQAIKASADADVQLFMFALDHTVELDLSEPLMIGGVSRLVALNLLTASRAALVLA